jgi:ABC-type Zn uptake system ZnuABC Zn-binding protein ZnuA
VQDADVIVTSGLGFDEWADDVISTADSGANVVIAGDDVPTKQAADGEEFTGDDPHWWHDPTNVKAASDTMAAAFATSDPDNADAYRKNAAAFNERLATLDTEIRACLDQIPADQRKIVTDHDAFQYFTARYGVTPVGAVIPSQSTQAQASAGELAALEKTIKAEDVKAVFPESSVNKKLAERLAEETGASADYTLYGDTLGEPGSGADTYIGMMQANAEAMVRGMSAGAESCTFSA